MKNQLQHFATYLDEWAAQASSRQEEALQWYRGEMPLPVADWGPAETIYEAFLLSQSPSAVKAALVQGIAFALESLAKKKSAPNGSGKKKKEKGGWTTTERMAVYELLRSCYDLAPAPDLQGPVEKILAHEKSSEDEMQSDAIRQALIHNQDDAGLKELWIPLLKGEKRGCLTPAPFSDIQGACRLGSNDAPAFEYIAEGIGLFARFHTESRDRRTFLHQVWQDLAEAWHRDAAGADWNWKLIEAGCKVGWEPWVFETMPCLYGEILGREGHYFLWKGTADVLTPFFAHCEQVKKKAPICLITWNEMQKGIMSEIEGKIHLIEKKRSSYSLASDKGLQGLLIDLAAEFTEPSKREFEKMPPGRVPTYQERVEASEQVFSTPRPHKET